MHCAVIVMRRDNIAADAFWRFSLMVYSRPGLAPALIALQDRRGHNVNLILFALWLAISGRGMLDIADLARACEAVAPLDQAVVAPLRQMRRGLRADPERDVQALRRRILALEIFAERSVQARLAANVAAPGDTGDRAAVAEINLRLVLGADFDGPEADVIRALAADLVSQPTPE
jgi:uncharacterized protein (TIGR02444 family)